MIGKSHRSLLLLSLVALILFAPIPAYNQSTTWQRYKAEGFSALLPEHPTSMKIGRSSTIFEPPKTGRLFGAYEDRVAYVILAFDNPDRRDPLSRFIEEVGDYPIGATAENFQQDISGKGFTAKEYTFSRSSTLHGVIRFYMTEDRVYVVQAIGEDVSKPSVKRFLDSFAIGSDAGARQINYSGKEPAEPQRTVADIQADETNPRSEVFTGKEVTTKVRVLIKPEPMYTEAARQSQTTGTVVLRGVLTSTGHVTKLRAVSVLPYGLTEQAIEAARNIKFIPATKDGRNVSMHIQLEYNFNLY
jgi:TonB family protein